MLRLPVEALRGKTMQRRMRHGLNRWAHMIAFEVKRNGKRICVAGAEDLGVLSATINAVGKLGVKTISEGQADDSAPVLFYSVGGLTRRRVPKKDVHLRWKSVSRLRLGDSLEVTVVEVRKADRPKSQANREKALRKLAKRRQTQHANGRKQLRGAPSNRSDS